MQANDLEGQLTFPIADAVSLMAQVRQSEAMRRCGRLIRDEVAHGRLVADLTFVAGERTARIDALGVMLDNPEALPSEDVGAYARIARDLTRALAYTTVDHELADRFAALSERQRTLLRFRNRPTAVPPSFVECGQQIGIGGEGARTLYHRTCRWLAVDSAPLLLPRIRSAIRAMATVAIAGGGLREMRAEVRRRGLLRVPRNFDDLLVFWRATDLECPSPSGERVPVPKTPSAPALPRSVRAGAATRVSARTHPRAPVAVSRLTLPMEVRQKAQRLSQSCGAFSLAWLAADLSAQALRPRLRRLGYTQIVPGWYWRAQASTNAVTTVTRKVCAVTPRVSPRDLRSALVRLLIDRELPTPPTHVVAALALRSGLVMRRGPMLVRTEALDPEAVLQGVEREVYRVLRDNGPVVSHHVLFEAICGAGYSPTSLTRLLQRSPIMWRIAPGRYALTGHSITHADIAAADARAETFDPAGALTYNIDGSVTYSVNAGPELLYRGFLDTGSLAAFAGEWRTPAGETVVVDERRVRGLKAGIRALGIEKGERIAVRFDTWTQTVTLTRETAHG